MKVINNVADVHKALAECTLDERLDILRYLIDGAQIYLNIEDEDRGTILTGHYENIRVDGIHCDGLRVTIPIDRALPFVDIDMALGDMHLTELEESSLKAEENKFFNSMEDDQIS